jgi:polyferredoxin
MIELLVFYVHIVGIAVGFTKRWREDGLVEGILAVLTMLLIFFVGWAMASFIVKLFMAPEGFGRFFNRDAAGLVLLTLGEAVFYYFYYREEKPAADRPD